MLLKVKHLKVDIESFKTNLTIKNIDLYLISLI